MGLIVGWAVRLESRAEACWESGGEWRPRTGRLAREGCYPPVSPEERADRRAILDGEAQP